MPVVPLTEQVQVIVGELGGEPVGIEIALLLAAAVVALELEMPPGEERRLSAPLEQIGSRVAFHRQALPAGQDGEPGGIGREGAHHRLAGGAGMMPQNGEWIVVPGFDQFLDFGGNGPAPWDSWTTSADIVLEGL